MSPSKLSSGNPIIAAVPSALINYISGAGTDSSEKGRQMWARVKGKTENDLMKLPFKQVYAFRPGFIKPVNGQKNVPGIYRYLGWIFPIGRAIYSGGFCKLTELAEAMTYVQLAVVDENVVLLNVSFSACSVGE